MADDKSPEKEPGIIQTLGSLQFGIVILIAITIVATAGTLIPQGQPYDFYTESYPSPFSALIRMFNLNDTYRSPLFIGLLGLFGLNLVLCSLLKFPRLIRTTFQPDKAPKIALLSSMQVYTRRSGTSLDEIQREFKNHGYRLDNVGNDRLFGEKGRFGRFGASLVHISLLVMLAGGVTSLLTGLRGHIVLLPGETTAVAELQNRETLPLGFEITLNRFDVSFYEEYPGRPKLYTSKVTVLTPDGESFDRDIQVNKPLLLNKLTVYQSSYGISSDNISSSAAEDDIANVAIRLNNAPADMPPITMVDLAVGEQLTVPGFGDSIKIALVELYRDFRGMGGQSGERNPAARFEITTTGGLNWNVYAFSRFPGMNMPMDPERPILLDLTGITGNELETETSGDVQYYTVLGVVRDRGVPVMWIGSLIMMAGLVLSFYFRPKRIWALVEGDTVHIAASVKGDPAHFRAFIIKIAPGKQIKN